MNCCARTAELLIFNFEICDLTPGSTQTQIRLRPCGSLIGEAQARHSKGYRKAFRPELLHFFNVCWKWVTLPRTSGADVPRSLLSGWRPG